MIETKDRRMEGGDRVVEEHDRIVAPIFDRYFRHVVQV